MTDVRNLERAVAAWMADEASAAASDQLLGDMLAVATSSRPRPRWLAFFTQSPLHVHSKVAVGSQTYRLALLATLLALLLGATIAVASSLLRPDTAADGWPGFRGDPSRSGVSATGPIGHPILVWQFQASGSVSEAIAIVGDLAIASSDDGVVHALALDSGMERWAFRVDTAPAHGPLAIGDRIFITDGGGSVYALGLDGRQVWQSTSVIAGPSDLTVGEGSLYGGSEDGTVAAFRVDDGVEQWRTTVSPIGAAIHAPSFGDGIVVAASDSGELAAIDAATGRIRWTKPVGPGTGTPAIAGDVAYIGSGATTATAVMRGYDLRSGDLRVATEEVAYSPTVIGGVGYAGGPLGVVSARDLASGVERWRTSFSGIVRPPVVAGDVLYVAADDERRIYALDLATGEELWHVPVDGSNWCCIAVARGVVVAGTRLGSVYAIGGDGTPVRHSAHAAPTATLTPPSPPTSALPTPTSGPVQANVVWYAVSPDAGFIPWGLSRDPQGRLWAVEALKDRFAIFDDDGTFIDYWGASGTGKGEFDLTRKNGDPFGAIAFAPDGSFYVLDVGNHRVQRFAADRSFVREWGRFGTGPGTFADPLSISVSPDGLVHVLDNERAVIESYDADGTVVRTIDAYPDEVGRTAGSNQVTVGPNGHFYLGLWDPAQVVELDADGKVLATYGGPGSGSSPFHEQPNVMAFDGQGRLYVTQGPARGDAPGVVVFSADGRYLGGWGRLGRLEGELGFPWGLVVDAGGDVFVSDAGALPEFGLASRLQRFRISLPGE